MNGKCPCRYCNISGVWVRSCRHYYFPSAIVQENDESGNECSFVERYDPSNLSMRTTYDIKSTWDEYENHPEYSQGQREDISKNTGIKPRTALFNIPSMVPFWSLPIDTMHFFSNIIQDMMALWKGDNSCVAGDSQDSFILSDDVWNIIDEALVRDHTDAGDVYFLTPVQTEQLNRVTIGRYRLADLLVSYLQRTEFL